MSASTFSVRVYPVGHGQWVYQVVNKATGRPVWSVSPFPNKDVAESLAYETLDREERLGK